MARYTATAAALVMGTAHSMGSPLRSSMVRYSPVPGGEEKLRPLRPRPPVCASATTRVPWGAPWAASSLAVRLVDTTSRSTTSRGTGRVRYGRTPCSDSTSLVLRMV